MRADAEAIGRAAIFEALDPADRSALALCFQGRKYAPGQVVFREGDPGASLLLVGEGSFVAAVRNGGMSREIGRFGPGGVIGASALVDRGPRRHTLTAVGPAIAYEVEADAIDLLRPTAPHAARALFTASLRALIQRLRKLEARVDLELDRSGLA